MFTTFPIHMRPSGLKAYVEREKKDAGKIFNAFV